jgi:hypothetical protein
MLFRNDVLVRDDALVLGLIAQALMQRPRAAPANWNAIHTAAGKRIRGLPVGAA